MNRKREKAKAAKAASATVKKPVAKQITIELRNQVQNGWSLRTVSKFCRLTSLGMSFDWVRLPTGSSAVTTTQ